MIRNTKKRQRLCRCAKWAGLAICVLVIVAWPVSVRRRTIVCVSRVQVSLKAGVLAFVLWEDRLSDKEPFYRYIVMPNLPDSPRWKPRLWNSSGNLNGEIPLYIFLFAVGIPTIILWRNDKRYPPGHCQKCGYDLTGNESGRCSECGKVI